MLENTPENPRKKLAYTRNNRILQDETPTSSIEGPHTRLRSRDQKERQDQEKSLSQNDEFDEGREAFTMPKRTYKNQGNQARLQNVGEQQRKGEWWMTTFKGARGKRTRTFQHFLLCKYRREYGNLRKNYCELKRPYQKQTEEMVALQGKL